MQNIRGISTTARGKNLFFSLRPNIRRGGTCHRPTDRQTAHQTDMSVNRQVTLPIIFIFVYSRLRRRRRCCSSFDIFLWKDICFWQCCNKHPPLHLLVLRFGWMFLLACCCWTTYTAPCFSPSPPLKPIRPPSPHRSSTQCVTEAILTQVLLFLRLDETRLRFSFRKVIGQLDMQLSYSWHTLKS